MEETIQALKEADIRDQVKIMAGGAPVTQDFFGRYNQQPLSSSSIKTSMNDSKTPVTNLSLRRTNEI